MYWKLAGRASQTSDSMHSARTRRAIDTDQRQFNRSRCAQNFSKHAQQIYQSPLSVVMMDSAVCRLAQLTILLLQYQQQMTVLNCFLWPHCMPTTASRRRAGYNHNTQDVSRRYIVRMCCAHSFRLIGLHRPKWGQHSVISTLRYHRRHGWCRTLNRGMYAHTVQHKDCRSDEQQPMNTQ